MTRAVVDDRDAVGEPIGLVEVLRGQQHGGAVRDEALDRLPQADAAARVEAGRRLVEEQDRRVGDEGGREVEAAAHAAGVGLGHALGGVGELEALEQLAGARLAPPREHAVEAADHHEVLLAGEVLVDRGVLPGEPDLGAQRARVTDDVEAGDAGAARVRRQQGGEDADGRGLAGAVGAEDAQYGARRDLEVDAVERAHLAERLHESADAGLPARHRLLRMECITAALGTI